MLKRFIPREHRFFDFFHQAADLVVEGANEFRDLLTHLDEIEIRTRNLKAIEHKADDVTHTTLELLHSTFITPLDRGDILELIKGLDDVIDMLEATSQRVHMYRLTTPPPHAKELADVCVSATEVLREAVMGLEGMKDPAEILRKCVAVHKWENEADLLLRAAIAKIFADDMDVKMLIKHKEIYELLETVTDRCETVANIIEGIVLEYA